MTGRPATLLSIAILSCLISVCHCWLVPQGAIAAQPELKTGAKRDTLLYVRTDPSGATILLDGKELGKSDGLFPVEPGAVRITVELEGRESIEKQVTIRASGITRVELVLHPQAEVGGAGSAGKRPQGTVRTVPYTVGVNFFRPGDSITITEVRATSPELKNGDRVIVKGHYTLASEPKASLCLFATFPKGYGTGPTHPGQRIAITKGEGAFELSETLDYDGYLRVSFYPVPGGDGFGGVYFGTAKQMEEIKDWDVRAWYGGEPRAARDDANRATKPETPPQGAPAVEKKEPSLEEIVLAKDLLDARTGNYWAKYRLWEAYAKGTGGVRKDPKKSQEWLAELVKGAYLVTFRPVGGFAPKTPGEFLAKFSEHSSLRLGRRDLAGASLFRTKAKGGVLIGSFLTAQPEQMRKDIAAMPFLELISMEKLTQKAFVRYEASEQESLDMSATSENHPAETPNDSLLDESQRLYRDWTEATFSGSLKVSPWQQWDPAERAKQEAQWIEQLSTLQGPARIPAINGLAALENVDAVPALLKIACDRREADNRDRWMAVRALGLIGDSSAVPELIDLTYHYNQNVRFWVQISLVRLTGQNFGRDTAAWKKWWKEQDGEPPVSEQTIPWTTQTEWMDSAKQAEGDKEFVERIKREGFGPRPPQSPAPQIVAFSPPNGAKDVDPGTRELRVTFNMPMAGGFSWTGGGPQFPKTTGRPRWTGDHKTCVFPVSLEPNRDYRLGLNSPSFKNFQSAAGVPLEPVEYTFTTGGAKAPAAGTAPEPAGEATIVALEAAKKWLGLVDAAKYGDAWENNAAFYKTAVAKAEFEKVLTGLRSPLGAVKSREVKSLSFTRTAPGAPDGQYVIIQFETQFEHKAAAIETVTPMLEKDGSWKVSGYYCK